MPLQASIWVDTWYPTTTKCWWIKWHINKFLGNYPSHAARVGVDTLSASSTLTTCVHAILAHVDGLILWLLLANTTTAIAISPARVDPLQIRIRVTVTPVALSSCSGISVHPFNTSGQVIKWCFHKAPQVLLLCFLVVPSAALLMP